MALLDSASVGSRLPIRLRSGAAASTLDSASIRRRVGSSSSMPRRMVLHAAGSADAAANQCRIFRHSTRPMRRENDLDRPRRRRRPVSMFEIRPASPSSRSAARATASAISTATSWKTVAETGRAHRAPQPSKRYDSAAMPARTFVERHWHGGITAPMARCGSEGWKRRLVYVFCTTSRMSPRRGRRGASSRHHAVATLAGQLSDSERFDRNAGGVHGRCAAPASRHMGPVGRLVALAGAARSSRSAGI